MGGGRRAGFRSLLGAVCLGRKDKSKECVGFPIPKLFTTIKPKNKKKKKKRKIRK